MNAVMTGNTQGQELARNLKLFEIDEALAALIESAQEEASENGGELSEQLKDALADYLEAFGEKVDRIANYLKGQESFVELAKREEDRLHTRRKTAENRAKWLKIYLGYWMSSRGFKELKGRLNSITLAKNSLDTLVVEQNAEIPDRYCKVTVELGWDEWAFLLNLLPGGVLRERLTKPGVVQKELNRAHLQEAIGSGVVLPGVRLIRGHHVRLR